jgi:hypothetical protein
MIEQLCQHKGWGGWIICLGFILTVLMYVWEGHQGFSLLDESYLWYGVQRVMAGEVPIRDFQAYDPGRYYWAAFFMALSGTRGIVAVRVAMLTLQALALMAAISCLVRGVKKTSAVYVVICALTLCVWMVPRHKLFDIAISIGLVCVLASFARRPSRLSGFMIGLFVGLAACVGRNHGAYGAIASTGLFSYLAIRCEDWQMWRRNIALCFAGAFVGYLPMLAMMCLVRGFAAAFFDSIKFIFEVKATNLPLPVPWPWVASFSGAPEADAVRTVFVGLFFVVVIVFPVGSTIRVVIERIKGRSVNPLLTACAFCSIPYAHFAFSRADLPHLAQSIFPALIGMLFLIMSAPLMLRLIMVSTLCIVSIFTALPMHPGWQCLEGRACERILVGSDVINVDRSTARDVTLFRQLDQQFSPQRRDFYVAPFAPGAYALLDAKSPTWEIYTAWPRNEMFQRQEIQRIQKSEPDFVIITDYALDGREDLRFRNTHPLINQYIQTNYIRVSGLKDNAAYQIYRPKFD